MKIGIPAALLYYQYYPMWKTFFGELGADVVVSPPTTRKMLVEGSSRVVADTCLPVKVFLGHVMHLAGECDAVFIPVVRSVEDRAYNCSKFLGLPDMTRAVIPETPPIMEIEIDINEGRNAVYRAVYGLGRKLSLNPLKVRKAAISAWRNWLGYREAICRDRIPLPDAIQGRRGDDPDLSRDPDAGRPVIALVGHPYLLYDEFVNHRIGHRLESMGFSVVTPEMVAPEDLDSGVETVSGHPYWTYEREVVGAGGHYLKSGVDGVIGIMAFGCGPDSLMMDMVRRYADQLGNTSFMCLTVDEHTAEAGVITRLEAFTDMVLRKKRKGAAPCV